jgi:ABC-2 type transport system ATP-binding protein
MTVFDQVVPDRLPDVVGRVGAIVESPKFFPAFSGRKNLELLADAIGAPRRRVGEVLEQTSLGERGNDRFKTYSLGMKQRLAIAATLLKEPELLIFDEPTNGLDPAGIREIRETMRALGQQGRTVLVSSHILAEVEQVADTVSIIGHGRLLASGTVAEVIGGTGKATVKVALDTLAGEHPASQERATAILTAAGMSVRAEGKYLLVDGAEHSADVTRRLAQQELYVSELVPVRADLESVFLELTADEGLGGDQ